MIKFIQLIIVFVGVMHSALPTSIVLLNGTTCSGKSSTAEVLTQLLCKDGKRAVRLSIDDAITKYDSPRSEVFKGIARTIGLGSDSIFADMLSQEIILLAQNPDNDFIVVDHCMRYDEMFCDTLLRLNGFNVFFVKIYCTYETATERLRQRNSIPGPSNRLPHLVDLHFHVKDNFKFLQNKPADFFPTIHDHKVYDLEIDTTNESTENCASAIKSILDRVPYAFLLNFANPYWVQKIQYFYTPEIIGRLLAGTQTRRERSTDFDGCF